jgi:hypothetical protein
LVLFFSFYCLFDLKRVQICSVKKHKNHVEEKRKVKNNYE